MIFTALDSCKKILAWLIPPVCLLCHQATRWGQDMCQGCRDELPILPQTCPRCAKTLTTPAGLKLICGACLKNPPPYDAAYALYSYEKPITKLIMELKFHERLVNARILGELMADAIQHHWYPNKALPDLIIPMPLHTRRLQERGFNQALEIARPIAKYLNIPLDITSCIRHKYTAAQARQSADTRSQNMKNAFTVLGDFSGRHIALLDDVTTTGYSMYELAKTLKKAGAPRIDVWFCARTLLGNL
jgi:ComF family protein